jgi:hypothetical protein
MNYVEQIIKNIWFVVARDGVEPRPSLSFHSAVAEEAHERPRHFPDAGSRLPELRRGRPKSTPSVETGLIRETLLGILVSVLTTVWLQEMAWDSRLKPGTSSSRISVGEKLFAGPPRSTNG